jgi:hypothetical protein
LECGAFPPLLFLFFWSTLYSGSQVAGVNGAFWMAWQKNKSGGKAENRRSPNEGQKTKRETKAAEKRRTPNQNPATERQTVDVVRIRCHLVDQPVEIDARIPEPAEKPRRPKWTPLPFPTSRRQPSECGIVPEDLQLLFPDWLAVPQRWVDRSYSTPSKTSFALRNLLATIQECQVLKST